jgi:hypothetical protein
VSARENAEEALLDSDAAGLPQWQQAYATVGIGWALLDVADAIREGREPTYSQIEFTTDADEAESHPVGTDPLNS